MPPQNAHEIFRKELELFEKEVFGYSMNEYSEQGDKIRPIMCNREDAKSFLLSSLRRASLAVVEESVGKIEKREFEQWSTKHLEFIRVSDSTKHGIATNTLATARTIVGEENK